VTLARDALPQLTHLRLTALTATITATVTAAVLVRAVGYAQTGEVSQTNVAIRARATLASAPIIATLAVATVRDANVHCFGFTDVNGFHFCNVRNIGQLKGLFRPGNLRFNESCRLFAGHGAARRTGCQVYQR